MFLKTKQFIKYYLFIVLISLMLLWNCGDSASASSLGTFNQDSYASEVGPTTATLYWDYIGDEVEANIVFDVYICPDAANFGDGEYESWETSGCIVKEDVTPGTMINGLNPDTPYNWAVTVYDSTDKENTIYVSGINTFTTVALAFKDLVQNSITTTSAVVGWTYEGTNTVDFIIYYGTDANAVASESSTAISAITFSSNIAITWKLTGLTPKTIHYWKVTSGSHTSDIKSFTNLVPFPDSGLSSTPESTRADVVWQYQGSDSSTKTIIYGRSASDVASATVDSLGTTSSTTASSDINTLVITGLEQGTTYYWKVLVGTESSTVQSFTTIIPFTSLSASPSTTTAALSWNYHGSYTGNHIVYYGTDANAVANRSSASVSGLSPISTDQNLTGLTANGVTYYWKVVKADDESEVDSFTTTFERPSISSTVHIDFSSGVDLDNYDNLGISLENGKVNNIVRVELTSAGVTVSFDVTLTTTDGSGNPSGTFSLLDANGNPRLPSFGGDVLFKMYEYNPVGNGNINTFDVTFAQAMNFIYDEATLGSMATNYQSTGSYLVTKSFSVSSTFPAIGDSTAPFTATIDGQGYTISGFTYQTGAETQDIGLFGYVQGGTIKNLKLADINVDGGSSGTRIGTLIGRLEKGTIENVAVLSGKVTSSSTLAGGGGLIGYMGGGTVRNSYSRANIQGAGSSGVGGLVGQLNAGTLENSYYAGSISISGNPSGVGGLIGTKNAGSTTGLFWDTETGGLLNSAAGTGKTTSEMKTISTFATWDTSIWNLVSGSYPTLK